MSDETPSGLVRNGGLTSSIRDKRNSVKRMQRASSTNSWTGSTGAPAGARTKRKYVHTH